MKILGISGSLRAGSFNTAVLKTMAGRTPDGVTMTVADISEIPLYNGDLDGDTPPAAVTAFKQAVEAADALIIATPEYNYSVPGVLKNALDWASRPAFNSVLKDKVTGIVSASMAPTGGVRAQAHLKTVLSGTLSPLVQIPEVMLASAHTLIEDGIVTDDRTLKYLDRLLAATVAAAEK